MKIVLLAFLLCSGACSASRSGKVTVVPRPTGAMSDGLIEKTRYPEVVAVYHLGRYVDPNYGSVLHEAHPVYRLESAAMWNLHAGPGCFLLPGTPDALTNAAFAPPPVDSSVIAEVNRQRGLTRAVIQQAQSLNSSLHDFATALSKTRQLAEQNQAIRELLKKSVERVDHLETELNKVRIPVQGRMDP